MGRSVQNQGSTVPTTVAAATVTIVAMIFFFLWSANDDYNGPVKLDQGF